MRRERPVLGSVYTVLGSVLSAPRVAKTLQGDPTTHPRRTQEGGAGDFSWSPARAFNMCVIRLIRKACVPLHGILSLGAQFWMTPFSNGSVSIYLLVC